MTLYYCNQNVDAVAKRDLNWQFALIIDVLYIKVFEKITI